MGIRSVLPVLNDLNNIGGTISANSELIVSAGRDINITSAVNTTVVVARAMPC